MLRRALFGFLVLVVLLGASWASRPRADAPRTERATALASDDFQARIVAALAEQEYFVSAQGEAIQAPNRRHDLRSYFEPTGVRVHDRTAEGSPKLVGLRLAGLGRGDPLTPTPPGTIRHEAGRVEIARPELGLVEWFENSQAGLEQGFTLKTRPESRPESQPDSLPRADAPSRESKPSELVLELSVEAARASLRGEEVALATEAGRMLSYGKLFVVDALGKELAARFEVPGPDRVHLIVDDGDATYPIVIDPLLTGIADAQLESDRNTGRLGTAVASAGDVNGDGYDDLIVGGGNNSFPNVLIYHGGPGGVGSGGPLVADTVITADSIVSNFGFAVAAAGDVNGDGYGDVLVGNANRFDAAQGILEGAAYVYLGGPGGIPNATESTAATRLESNQDGSQFGSALASAGDVNGDGYDDVVIGAGSYDNGQTDEGAAFIFLGSASGIPNGNPATAHARLESNQVSAILRSVASAGDVNADGYDDVIVGAGVYDNGTTNEGAAFVFLGSAAGIANGHPGTAAAILESNQAAVGGGNPPGFGDSVSSAGDVDGDGYDDVIVGAPQYDSAPSGAGLDEGYAFVFLGSATGIASGNPLTAAASFRSNQGGGALTGASFGSRVASAGDVNGDGRADVVVAAHRWDGGQVDEGAVFVYLGAARVGSTVPFSLLKRLEVDQAGVELGRGAASAGDLNGDGYDEVVAGAPIWNGGNVTEGGVFVWHGGALGVSAGDPLASSGLFVDLTGFNVPLGSGEDVPYSIAPAGDVNGDGYGDLILGISQYDDPFVDSGVAIVVHGSATGLPVDPSPLSADTLLKGDQSGGFFGSRVSSAGDVNGDGYGDVIVASRFYDAGQIDEGAAFVFLGSATGVASGGPANAHARLEMDQANAGVNFVAFAGDVNGDGFADVAVSSHLYDAGTTDEGAAFVFLGSVAGVANGGAGTAHARFETDQAGARARAYSAGDLNGDGFGDLVVHSELYDAGQIDEGASFVLLGSSSGMTSSTPATAHATFEIDQAGAGVTSHAFSPGDIDGDGYSELLVSAPRYSEAQPQEGAAFVLYGSSAGLIDGNPTTANTKIRSNRNGALMGISISALPWDVNADGFADLLFSTFGLVEHFFFLGSSAGISSGDLTGASSSIADSGVSRGPGGDINGDGHGDLLTLSVAFAPPYFTGITFSSILADRGGRPVLARQRRGDGSGAFVAPGGDSRANQFEAQLFLRSPRGREYGKLEVEYCPGADAVLGAPNCLRVLSPSWTDLGTSGATLSQTIPGLAQDTPYKWRARGHYAAYRPSLPGPTAPVAIGPWYRVQGRPSAMDIRTPAPEPILDLTTVYREDFSGESAFPTTPEIDVFGLGGLTPVGFGVNTQVTLDGIRAHVSLQSANEITTFGGVSRGWSGVAGEPLQATATFDDFVISQTGVPLQFLSIETPFDNGSFVASLRWSLTGEMHLFASTTGTSGDSSASLPIPSAEVVAMLNGASVKISTLYFESEGRITSEIEVDGFPKREGPTLYSDLGSPSGILRAYGLNFESAPFPSGSLDVDLLSLEIAVPEPALGSMLGAGGVALSLLHARRRRRFDGMPASAEEATIREEGASTATVP